MSLTSLLNQPDIRARFRQEFPTPRLPGRPELRVPSLSRDPGHIGTAFDYLLRFYVQRLNPGALIREWVAEEALRDLHSSTTVKRTGRRVVADAQAHLQRYLETGELRDELIVSALALARLDLVVRAERPDYIDKPSDPQAVTELRQLLGLVDPAFFTAQQFCALNPTFGIASNMVGGADADLILDDTLIELKTTKDSSLKRAYINQVVGYYLLVDIGGLSLLDETPAICPPITKVAIYFSRQGYLHVMEVRELLNPETYPAFREWFQDRAWEESQLLRSPH